MFTIIGFIVVAMLCVFLFPFIMLFGCMLLFSMLLCSRVAYKSIILMTLDGKGPKYTLGNIIGSSGFKFPKESWLNKRFNEKDIEQITEGFKDGEVIYNAR